MFCPNRFSAQAKHNRYMRRLAFRSKMKLWAIYALLWIIILGMVAVSVGAIIILAHFIAKYW